MASLVRATPSNTAEQIQLLKTQADTAYAQQKAAEKAVASFADLIKNNPTSENQGKLQKLLTTAQEATGHAAELRKKSNEAECAYYNPYFNPSLADGSGA